MIQRLMFGGLQCPPGTRDLFAVDGTHRERRTNLDTLRSVVADDWQSLRACDVYRLLDITPDDDRGRMVAEIAAHRPDLASATSAALVDLDDDRRGS